MIRNALQRFMYGRYGNDQLNMALLVLYLALYLVYFLTGYLVYFLTGFDPLYWISFAVILFALFRLLSRNPARRRAENARFLKVAGPAIQWFRLRRTIHRDKEHCYFKCPNCGQQLRVPRGKGKITVTCRSCGAVFEEKS